MRSLWMITLFAIGLSAQPAPEIRFRIEALPASAKRAAAKPADFGLVNRVRYRVAQGDATLTVEREPVAAPDPQQGTRACPAPAPEAPWTKETFPAAPGWKALGWGDFDYDGKGNFTEHRIHEDQSAYEVRLVDMNGDGAPDILAVGQGSQNVVWHENRLMKRPPTVHAQPRK